MNSSVLMYFVSCFSFPIGGRILTLLCREILLHEPFKFKLKSAEEKEAWETSADNFNAIGDPKFKVTPTSVRDRYTYLYLSSKKSTQL